MTPRNDIDLKVYVDPVTYLALKHRCHQVDRTLSEHLRHLIHIDLIEGSAEERADGRGDAGPAQGQDD